MIEYCDKFGLSEFLRCKRCGKRKWPNLVEKPLGGCCCGGSSSSSSGVSSSGTSSSSGGSSSSSSAPLYSCGLLCIDTIPTNLTATVQETFCNIAPSISPLPITWPLPITIPMTLQGTNIPCTSVYGPANAIVWSGLVFVTQGSRSGWFGMTMGCANNAAWALTTLTGCSATQFFNIPGSSTYSFPGGANTQISTVIIQTGTGATLISCDPFLFQTATVPFVSSTPMFSLGVPLSATPNACGCGSPSTGGVASFSGTISE